MHNMDFKPLPASQFFSPVICERDLDIARECPQLESFFSQDGRFDGSRKITLTDNFLFVSTKAENGFKCTHFLPLSCDLKFQRIKDQRRSDSQKSEFLGFSLYHSDQFVTKIYIQFPSLTSIWIRWLTKNLIEVGFKSFYRPICKIGQGSTSEVWEVEQLADGQRFAAKVILKQYLAAKKDRMAGLENEIALLRQIDHPNLMRLEAVLQSETSIYLICERLIGGTLTEQISFNKGFNITEVKYIMRGILEGLEYLHKFGIAHRDIKMENIMFRQGKRDPVIVDFGLAVFTEDEPYIFYRCGTPGYVAPEIIRMKQHRRIRVECDIFSVGAVFHILLMNQLLFEGTKNEEIYSKNLKAQFDLSSRRYQQKDREAVELLRKMLTVNPGLRISASEALDEPFLQLTEDGLEVKRQFSPTATTDDSYLI